MGLSKDEIELVKTVFIVGCITVLEVFNIIYFKVDGAILGLVIGGLFGLLGYKVGKLKMPSEEEIAINKPEE
jgi:hypothetical protein